jgi:hypothetical protein
MAAPFQVAQVSILRDGNVRYGGDQDPPLAALNVHRPVTVAHGARLPSLRSAPAKPAALGAGPIPPS